MAASGSELLDAVLGRIVAIAEADPDREVCGFVLANAAAGPVVVGARNAAEDPSTGFRIDPADVLAILRRAERGGAEVAAVFHSHPSGGGALSARDHDGFSARGSPVLPGAQVWIIAMERGRAIEVRAHRWTSAGYAEVSRRRAPFTV
jgi:proteasome lid subunit RPN8/RPN11